jgi:O-antigen ligase
MARFEAHDTPQQGLPGTLGRLRDFVRQCDLLAISTIICLALILVVPNTQVYRWFFYVAVLPCFALSIERALLSDVMRSWVWRFAIALLFYLWLTILWGEDPNLRDALNYVRRTLMIMFFVTIVAFLVAERPNFTRLLFRWLVGVAALTAVVQIARQTTPVGLSRIGSLTVPTPNVAGDVYGTLIAGGFFFALAGARTWSARVLFALALIIMMMFVVLTQSRGPIGAIVGTLLVLALFTRRREILLAAGLGIASVATLMVSGLLELGVLVERGLSYRPEVWEIFFKLWREHPWFGIGVNVVRTFSIPNFPGFVLDNSHSFYLGHLVLGGIPALILLLLMLGAGVRTAVTAYRHEGELGPLAMLLFVTIAGTVEFGVFLDNVDWQWLFFWLPIGLIAGVEARERRLTSANDRTVEA